MPMMLDAITQKRAFHLTSLYHEWEELLKFIDKDVGTFILFKDNFIAIYLDDMSIHINEESKYFYSREEDSINIVRLKKYLYIKLMEIEKGKSKDGSQTGSRT